MTTTTQKIGRVSKLADIKGLMEYRFVPKDWAPPLVQLAWYEFDPIRHADEYQRWREDIEARSDRLRVLNPEAVWNYEVAWFKDGQPVYTARIDYDPIERPMLIAVGGFAC